MTKLPQPRIGMRLPELALPLTRKLIIMGAAATRDWQPQHHDPDWAREAGLPDIIMNNYTQAGLISRFVTDWSGPMGRIGRLRFAMRRPICPGGVATFNGMVVDVTAEQDGMIWVEIDIEVLVAEKTVTTATVKLALPATARAPSPWHCPAVKWHP
ncbi:MaoC/PaaZ C-terminal domain-containing protein [Parasphingorhabdus sp.]|uniref:MaoC/PaaZ C-terminal domain-containing protein n=1 Tax=Parasphingorhabdus sp. TaxID=2709688 RepID=UPI003A958D96